MHTVNQIRSAFIDFFEKNDHRVLASSSLIPLNDPSLMVTNAGMVQFKNIFTDVENKQFDRAVTSQKCVRVSQKRF